MSKLKQLTIFFGILPLILSAETDLDSAEFKQKLNQSRIQLESSIEVLRKQIVASEQAPFLPQLYIQLGDLLSEKAKLAYLIHAQKLKDSGIAEKDSYVPSEQKEAILVYKRLLNDFSDFKQKDLVFARLAEAYLAAGDKTNFVQSAQSLFKAYPVSEYAVKIKILLGDFYFSEGLFQESFDIFKPLISSKNIYDKNLARYKMGLALMGLGKYADTLKAFESVLLDPQLKESNDNKSVIEVINQKQSIKSDLKSRALIDSVAAYTYVYKNGGDPLTYYARLSPSEVHYREVLEKLTARFIELKKYDKALDLLRVICKGLQNPKKTLIIQRQVLLALPSAQRVYIKPTEIEEILEAFLRLKTFFDLPIERKKELESFLELQARELATSAHDQAKKNQTKELFLRAAKIYRIYLDYFPNSIYKKALLTNLADCYFWLKDYLNSGELYLTLAQTSKNRIEKKKYYESAIFALQDKAQLVWSSLDFYDRIRITGLLMRSIQLYWQTEPEKKKDTRLNFLLAKATFQQGFTDTGLNLLYTFMKTFPRSQSSRDAVEVILDYFNTKGEYLNLEQWAKKISALHLPFPDLKQRLSKAIQISHTKSIEKQVEKLSGFDAFSEGKSYLTAALQTSNTELRNELLKGALAKAKQEADYETFIGIADKMAQSTSQPATQQQIYDDIGNEIAAITDYTRAYQYFLKAIKVTSTSSEAAMIHEKNLNLALMLRDWDRIYTLLSHPLYTKVSEKTKTRLMQQAQDALATTLLPQSILESLLHQPDLTDEGLANLWMMRSQLPASLQQEVKRLVTKRCTENVKSPVCLLEKFSRFQIKNFDHQLRNVPQGPAGIEKMRELFLNVVNSLQSFQGSAQPNLEAAAQSYLGYIYRQFGNALNSSNVSADLKPILQAKAQESLKNAQVYDKNCHDIIQQFPYLFKTKQVCETHAAEIFFQRNFKTVRPVSIPTDSKIIGLRKKMFQTRSGENLLNLSKAYFHASGYEAAAASASQGQAEYPNLSSQFSLVLGCSLRELGFFAESEYHLRSLGKVDCNIKEDV